MEKMSLTFQALSEEIRLRILALLINTDELCVCDFMEALKLPLQLFADQVLYPLQKH